MPARTSSDRNVSTIRASSVRNVSIVRTRTLRKERKNEGRKDEQNARVVWLAAVIVSVTTGVVHLLGKTKINQLYVPLCSTNEFSKKYQCSKNELRKKLWCSRNEFSKKYQCSRGEFSS